VSLRTPFGPDRARYHDVRVGRNMRRAADTGSAKPMHGSAKPTQETCRQLRNA